MTVAFLFTAGLIAAWTGAWLVARRLESLFLTPVRGRTVGRAYR